MNDIKADNLHYTYSILRNGMEIKIGYGILTKNPMQVTHKDLNWRRNLVWLFYDEHWYLVAHPTIKSLLNCITYFRKHPTNSKDELFELIYNLVVKKTFGEYISYEQKFI